MSTQDVRITSMPDTSTAGVALELWNTLRGAHGGETLESKLKLFVACRKAAGGSPYDISGLS